jgi:hypothetical protein
VPVNPEDECAAEDVDNADDIEGPRAAMFDGPVDDVGIEEVVWLDTA